jgi:hypothetical protein
MSYENVSSLPYIYSDEKVLNYAMFSGTLPPPKMEPHCPDSKCKFWKRKHS